MIGHIILVRGLPGSGKSTIARDIVSNQKEAVHFEADMFFIDKNGVYSYNPKLIKEAHKWCQQVTKEAYLSGKLVVVSNTFVKKWEMQPYFNIDQHLHVIEAKGSYINVHNVSQEVIDRMKANWEELE